MPHQQLETFTDLYKSSIFTPVLLRSLSCQQTDVLLQATSETVTVYFPTSTDFADNLEGTFSYASIILDSVIAFWYTRNTFISNEKHCVCLAAIALRRQPQCVLCGRCVHLGFIKHMCQTVCVDGLTEMVAEGEC